MYIWDIGQVRVRVESTVSTAYQETYLGVLEGLLCRWGLADAHHERKDTDNRGSRGFFAFFCFIFYYLKKFKIDFWLFFFSFLFLTIVFFTLYIF